MIGNQNLTHLISANFNSIVFCNSENVTSRHLGIPPLTSLVVEIGTNVLRWIVAKYRDRLQVLDFFAISFFYVVYYRLASSDWLGRARSGCIFTLAFETA